MYTSVPEEPEQVLEHAGRAAGGVEEVGVEVAVREQHGDRAGQHGQREQQQEHGHQIDHTNSASGSVMPGRMLKIR